MELALKERELRADEEMEEYRTVLRVKFNQYPAPPETTQSAPSADPARRSRSRTLAVLAMIGFVAVALVTTIGKGADSAGSLATAFHDVPVNRKIALGDTILKANGNNTINSTSSVVCGMRLCPAALKCRVVLPTPFPPLSRAKTIILAGSTAVRRS
jgi:hypothetical protein